MKTWMMILVATVVVPGAQLAYSSPSQKEDGRYEGVGGSANAVWVIDTRTGQVRKCTQEFADKTPVCSAFSE